VEEAEGSAAHGRGAAAQAVGLDVDAARGLVGLGEQGEVAEAVGPDSIGAGGAF
jgi:hypothetical protein